MSVPRTGPLTTPRQCEQRAELWPKGSSPWTSQKGQRRELAPVLIRCCILLTHSLPCCTLGEVCRRMGRAHIGHMAHFLVRHVAYLQRDPASKILAAAVALRSIRGLSLLCDGERLGGPFVLLSLSGGTVAPPEELLPASLRKRLCQRALEALSLVHTRLIQGEIRRSERVPC